MFAGKKRSVGLLFGILRSLLGISNGTFGSSDGSLGHHLREIAVGLIDFPEWRDGVVRLRRERVPGFDLIAFLDIDRFDAPGNCKSQMPLLQRDDHARRGRRTPTTRSIGKATAVVWCWDCHCLTQPSGQPLVFDRRYRQPARTKIKKDTKNSFFILPLNLSCFWTDTSTSKRGSSDPRMISWFPMIRLSRRKRDALFA